MATMRLLFERYKSLIVVFLFLGLMLIRWTYFQENIVDLANPEQRLGFSQLIVEYLGLGALGIALLEFSRQLATPRLEVWAEYLSPTGERITSDETIDYYHLEYNRQRKFVVNASFRLLVRNIGAIPAQYINCTIRFFREDDLPPSVWSDPAITQSTLIGREQNWHGGHSQIGLPFATRFTGDADLVLHTSSRDVPHIIDAPEDWNFLAEYTVMMSGERKKWENARIVVRCTTQCLNTKENVTEFLLSVPMELDIIK